MGNVRIIPATIDRQTFIPIASTEKRKVAGYARVSTEMEEQQTSYEAQIDYYTHYIKERDDWEFVRVYTDEGLSATSTKKREGFQEMVDDALAGKITLIVTKSVSRFARNTVDSLTTIRKLKEHGCEVYFEKENIWTFDSKGELLLTIMSSLAQEESRSISENVRWGQRKKAADGKFSVNYKHFLGYDKGPDGKLVVNPEQAKVVRRIFSMFMEGYNAGYIAKALTEEGVPSPAGKAKWYAGTIRNLIQNEKYRGDALLQKTYSIDFLSKARLRNRGEVPQYYVEGDHEAIIAPELFDRVQDEIARRKHKKTGGGSVFSGKIFCNECGMAFGPKVWHSTDKYRRIIWQCNGKFENGCRTPHLSEEEIMDGFKKALAAILPNKAETLRNLKIIQKRIEDTSELDSDIRKLTDRLDALSVLIQQDIEKNAHVALDQKEYTIKHKQLTDQFQSAADEISRKRGEVNDKKARSRTIAGFIKALSSASDGMEFDPALWGLMVDKVTVFQNKKMDYTLADGEIVRV